MRLRWPWQKIMILTLWPNWFLQTVQPSGETHPLILFHPPFFAQNFCLQLLSWQQQRSGMFGECKTIHLAIDGAAQRVNRFGNKGVFPFHSAAARIQSSVWLSQYVKINVQIKQKLSHLRCWRYRCGYTFKFRCSFDNQKSEWECRPEMGQCPLTREVWLLFNHRD